MIDTNNVEIARHIKAVKEKAGHPQLLLYLSSEENAFLLIIFIFEYSPKKQEI